MHDCKITEQRLAPNGRGINNQFPSTEKLFFRFSDENWIDGQLAVTAIRCPDYSVNRARYSEAEDVTCPRWHGWGVISWTVGRIRATAWQDGNSARYTLEVVHEPLDKPDEKNYAHSAVQFRKNGEHKGRMKVADGAKDHIRDTLARSALIEIALKDTGEPR